MKEDLSPKNLSKMFIEKLLNELCKPDASKEGKRKRKNPRDKLSKKFLGFQRSISITKYEVYSFLAFLTQIALEIFLPSNHYLHSDDLRLDKAYPRRKLVENAILLSNISRGIRVPEKDLDRLRLIPSSSILCRQNIRNIFKKLLKRCFFDP